MARRKVPRPRNPAGALHNILRHYICDGDGKGLAQHKQAVINSQPVTVRYSANLRYCLALQSMWCLFGPVSFQSRRDTRVTFVAGFITLPLTAVSLWQLLKPHDRPSSPPQLSSEREINLSGK